MISMGSAKRSGSGAAAVQVACAGRNHAEFLVTRNVRDYSGALYPQIILPELLLAILASLR